ncbi:DUF3857 domain-containing protein [bacterium]|nr:DUF3857 domain-containing protein [candidate division CSSED10-310 bacterium]
MKRLAGWILIVLMLFPIAAFSDDSEIWDAIKSSKKEFKDDLAVIAFDRICSEYQDDGSAVTREEILIHFRKESAAGEYRTINYDYNPRTSLIRFLEVRIYRSDGKTVDPVPLDTVFIDKAPADLIFWNFDVTVCPVPYLRENDALYYKIERRGLNLAYLNKEEEAAWDRNFIPPQPGYFMDTVYFQSELPIIEKSYRISGPRSKPLQFAMANGTMDVSLKLDGDKLVYFFQVKNQEGYHREPFDVGFNDQALKLAMASHPSWEIKSQWSYHHNEPQFVISEEMQRKVDEITAPAEDDDDKMFRLLHWVAEEIRYLGLDMGEGEGHKVHRTDEIFKDRVGVCKDKAAVLVSMLRAAGFDAYFVMTLAMEQTLDIPADDRFNHGVVAVRKPDEKWVFLDPTWAPQNRPLFNYLEQEQPVLIAAPEGCVLMHVPYSPPEQSPFVVDAKSSLNLDGSASVFMRIQCDGYPDGRLRSSLDYFSRDMRSRIFWDIIEDLSPRAVLTDYSFTAPQDFHTPMQIEIAADIPDAALKIGDDLLFTPLLTRHIFSERYQSDYLHLPTGIKERKHAVELACTRLIKFHEKLQIPDGYHIETLPDPVKMEGPTLDLDFNASADSRTGYSFDQTIRIKRRVTPPEDYPILAESIKKLGEIRDVRITARKTGNRTKNPRSQAPRVRDLGGARSLPSYGAEVESEAFSLTLEPDGKIIESFYTEARVYNENGRDNFADHRFIVNDETQNLEVLECTTTTPGGTVHTAPGTAVNMTIDDEALHAPDYRNIRNGSVSLVGIETGSVLKTRVRRTTKPGIENPVERRVTVGRSVPVARQTITVELPESHTLSYRLCGLDTTPHVMTESGVTRYVWTFTDLQPVVPEYDTGSYIRNLPVLIFSTAAAGNWENRIDPLRTDFFSFEPVPESIRNRCDMILKDVHGPAFRISALRDFVANNIIGVDIEPRRFHFRTRPVERILESGYGYPMDRMKLLAALVQAASGSFELCFSGPEQSGSGDIPCLTALTDLFARIRIGTETAYVSLDESVFSIRDKWDHLVLAVGPEGFSWIDMSPWRTASNTSRMDLNLTVTDDLEVSGSIEVRYAGCLNPYDSIRINTDKWIDGLLEELLEKPEIIRTSILSLAEPPDGTTHAICEFTGKLVHDEIEENLIRINWINCPGGIQDFDLHLPMTEKRFNPVRIDYPCSESVRISITCPEKWKPVVMPATTGIRTNTVHFTRSVKQLEQTITLNKELTFSANTISSGEYMQLVRAWQAHTLDSENSTIFKIPTSDE